MHTRSARRIGLLIVSAGLLALAGAAAARSLYVSPVGTNNTAPGNQYPDWAGAATNIQAAITVARDGDVIYVTNATYYLTAYLNINSNITLRSFNNGALDREGTILDGNSPNTTNTCLWMRKPNALVAGFTIRNGRDSPSASGDRRYGGGAFLDGGTLSNCIVYNNTAQSAGGICMSTGLVTHCLVVSNYATNYTAGGIFMSGNTNMTVRNSQILYNMNINTRSNQSTGGIFTYGGGLIENCLIAYNHNTNGSYGGVCNQGGILRGSTIAGNTAYLNGGGIGLSATGLVEHCVIVSNLCFPTVSGAYGGGVYLPSGNGTLRNCLVANNTAYRGGGILANPPAVSVVNCTISSNTAPDDGAGIYWNATVATNLACVNSIVYFNSSVNIRSPNVARYTNCCVTPSVAAYGENNTTNDPLFVARGSNYRLIRESPTMKSPGINAGLNEPWMDTAVDLDGRQRIDRLNGRVDMGPYETVWPGNLLGVR